MTKRLSLSEYARRPNERKDIYAFIHTLVKTIKELVTRHQESGADPRDKKVVKSAG